MANLVQAEMARYVPVLTGGVGRFLYNSTNNDLAAKGLGEY